MFGRATITLGIGPHFYFDDFRGLLYWRLEQLNAELSKRKVKVSGKKAELTERLKWAIYIDYWETGYSS